MIVIYIHICYILWIMYIDFCAITHIYIDIYLNIEYEGVRCSSKIWIEHEESRTCWRLLFYQDQATNADFQKVVILQDPHEKLGCLPVVSRASWAKHLPGCSWKVVPPKWCERWFTIPWQLVRYIYHKSSYNVGPPSYVCWFINPINYSYKYHKP